MLGRFLLQFKFIDIHDREVVFKHMHGILPTKLRLFHMKQKSSGLCQKCNVPEDNIHMFVECKKIKDIFLYFKTILKDVSEVKI